MIKNKERYLQILEELEELLDRSNINDPLDQDNWYMWIDDLKELADFIPFDRKSH